MTKGPIHPAVRFTSGKGDFIKRRISDKITQNICVGIQNVDFFMGCPAQVPGELMREVILNDGQYDPERVKRCEKKDLPDGRCEYCYDKRKNSGKLNLRRITREGKESTLGDFERVFGEGQTPPFRVIRISKFTEGGHPIAMPLLAEFLGLCKQFDVATVLPTKALPFGKKGLTRKVRDCLTQEVIDQVPSEKDLAKLFIDTNSAIYYSLGYRQLETGLVSQGFTPQWRIQQAKGYHEAGVRTSLTVVCDVTRSIKENVKYKSAIDQALKAREKGLVVRILPIRLNSRKVARTIGLNWDEVHYKEPEKMDSNQTFLEGLENYDEDVARLADEKGTYIRLSTGSVPRILHPDFAYLIGEEELGVCGRIGENECCDMCNLQDNVRISFPADELIKVTYDPKLKEAKKRRQQRKRFAKGGQESLFDPYSTQDN